jgi:hypothetical protein
MTMGGAAASPPKTQQTISFPGSRMPQHPGKLSPPSTSPGSASGRRGGGGADPSSSPSPSPSPAVQRGFFPSLPRV